MNNIERTFRDAFTAHDPNYQYPYDIHLSGFYHWGNEMAVPGGNSQIIPGHPLDMGDDYVAFSVDLSGRSQDVARIQRFDLVKMKREEIGYYERVDREDVTLTLPAPQPGQEQMVTMNGIHFGGGLNVAVIGDDRGEVCWLVVLKRTGATLEAGQPFLANFDYNIVTAGGSDIDTMSHWVTYQTGPDTFALWGMAGDYTLDTVGLVIKNFKVTGTTITEVSSGWIYRPFPVGQAAYYLILEGKVQVSDTHAALYLNIDADLSEQWWVAKVNIQTGAIDEFLKVGDENQLAGYGWDPYTGYMSGGRERIHVRQQVYARQNAGNGYQTFEWMVTIDVETFTILRAENIDYPPSHPPGLPYDDIFAQHDDYYAAEDPYGSLWNGNGVIHGAGYPYAVAGSNAALSDDFFSLYLWDGDRYTASLLLSYNEDFNDPLFFPDNYGELPGKTFDVRKYDDCPGLAIVGEEWIIFNHTYQYYNSPYYIAWCPKVEEPGAPVRVNFTRGRA